MSKFIQVESKKYLTVYGHQGKRIKTGCNVIANSYNEELRNDIFDRLLFASFLIDNKTKQMKRK